MESVLFLKEKSEHYTETFKAYDTCFIPILSTSYNKITTDLRDSIVIVTSQRAIESIESISETVFAVGEKTATAIESKFKGVKNIIGKEAGNATELSKMIIAFHNQNINHKEFVFVAGEDRRNEIPDSLNNNGIKFREIVSYKTDFNEKFSECFRTWYSERKKSLQSIWIVFFSPRGVNFGIEIILSELSNQNNVGFAFIGATTFKEFTNHPVILKYSDTLKYRVAVASYPSAESLLESILKATVIVQRP